VGWGLVGQSLGEKEPLIRGAEPNIKILVEDTGIKGQGQPGNKTGKDQYLSNNGEK